MDGEDGGIEMKNAKLTDKERKIIVSEYEKHKRDNIPDNNLCPVTRETLDQMVSIIRAKTASLRKQLKELER